MSTNKKHPAELRERATRLAVEARKNPATERGAIPRVAKQLGIHPETLRDWVRKAETDNGTRPGLTTAEVARIKELELENRELRRANQILKSSAAFLAAEFDRPSR